MKLIPLTKGYFAKVDDEDFERLSKYNWQVSRTTGNPSTIYAKRGVRMKHERPVRVVTFLMHIDILGKNGDLEIDHIDGDGLNNQRSNLRFVTRSQNIMNCRPETHSTPYKGVSMWKNNGKFSSHIRKNRILHYLGSYETAEDAALVYDYHAQKMFGEHALTNRKMGLL